MKLEILGIGFVLYGLLLLAYCRRLRENHGPLAKDVWHGAVFPGDGVSVSVAPLKERPERAAGFQWDKRTWARFIYAVGAVESGWDYTATNGYAIGVLQITPVVPEELNRLGIDDADGREWVHARCRHSGYSILCARAYLNAVAPGGDPERWARVWRKGPSGWGSDTAARYWELVKAEMQTEG